MLVSIIITFIVGYLLITLEQPLKVNKTAIALATGTICWLIYIVASSEKSIVNEHLLEQVADIAGILFFLMGAMTIVELIDAHNGFDVISRLIHTSSKRVLLFTVAIIAFILSAVLDNLTTTIVMVALIRKLVKEQETRRLYASIIIIAANAGGAWSPIGDVTTTMLWIGGQISSLAIIRSLFLPSLVSLLVPILFFMPMLKGKLSHDHIENNDKKSSLTKVERNLVFYGGIFLLLLVPVFKTVTHLPPFMGMLFSLGILWIATDLLHRKKELTVYQSLSAAHALSRIDIPSIMFFLGILLSVGALGATGVLESAASQLEKSIGNIDIIVLIIGLLSAIVDNVPLVAAGMKMYPLSSYPLDHILWEFLAYCAGTGGSILIIGSAAGVAAMGMEKINFGWYLRKVSFPALVGYFAGAGVYLLLR